MRCIVLDSLELLNGAGWSAIQHRVAKVDSLENQTACELSPPSLDGVCVWKFRMSYSFVYFVVSLYYVFRIFFVRCRPLE